LTLQPRSYLFVPGDREARLAKAPSLGADAVIMDLEDAVAMGEKEAARDRVRRFLAAGSRVPLFVRVNALGTPWHEDDVRGVVGPGLSGIVLPKAESAEGVVEVDRRVGRAEEAAGLEAGTVELVVLVETAAGILHAAEIAAATPRVTSVAFGAYDLARDLDLRLTPGGEELLVPRVAVVLAARAAGRTPVDTVFADIGDSDGLERECRRARDLGFAAKLCIHPGQVAAIHRHFSPSPAELEEARRVVEAFERAEAEGRAAITVDGRLVDYPIALQQRALLERGRALGIPGC
jgi:citrate lyase subunit beta/citryl-CoA lyase